jgi:spore coat polysaccharide biosynthesis predicted glycosyltransferase SpsG
MPVRPDFTPASISAIEDFRARFNLDDSSIILINGGARGGGPLLEIYKSVRRAAATANILVVCGSNDRLRSRIDRMQHERTRTFGFITDIHQYVSASDLVITKPGALSAYEALACGVPVLLTNLRCLMPQESGLFDAAHHYDFGFAAQTLDELESILRKGPIVWRRKRESIPQFYDVARTSELIERIQTADVA